MKSLYKIIFAIVILTCWSCTDVVDVETPEAESRLVVEASIDWEKGTLGNNQTIKLSTSVPYFDELSNNAAIGASVKITNDDTIQEFIFVDQGNGDYTTSIFTPVLNQSYTLEIIYNGEVFTANETLTPVTDIEEVNQSITDGFNDEALEVNVLFNDPINEENFYFFKFREQGDLLPELLDISDEFTNGNQMKVFFEKEDDEDINQTEFEPGDIVNIEFFGVSEQYFNYMRLLIEQYGSAGDPFGSVPVPLKGNCLNTTNSEKYAYGYFRLTQAENQTYTYD